MANELKKERWEKWMTEAVSGNEASYHLLLSEISQALRLFLSKRVRDSQALEDVLQEILIGIHQARHTYDVNRSFTAWMYAIARYKMIDYFRKVSRDAPLVFVEDMGAQGFEMEVEDEHHFMDELKKLIEQLPEKQKNVVVSMKIEGLSVKETASKFSMSESAVKVTAHRAYQAMKKKWRALEN